MKSVISLLVFACLVTSFHAGSADELRPAQAYSLHLGSVTGIVYFETMSPYDQLIATLSAGPDATPVRVITTLTTGQSTTVSVPRGLDESALEVTFARHGDKVFVTGAGTVVGNIR